MRMLFLTSLAASFWSLGATATESCGLTGQACCKHNFCSDVDAECYDGVCLVVSPGQGACTGKGSKRGEPCCNGSCGSDELSCSEGTCVNVNEEPVLVQSGPQPGEAGGQCIGDDQICDEDEKVALECMDGICTVPDGVKDQSLGEICGNLNEECCYAAVDTPLCAFGFCAPRENADRSDIKQLPCVCSETICVKNAEFCPEDAMCAQSGGELEACGQEGDPCCVGVSCDEDVVDEDGDGNEYFSLVCNPNFFDEETGQSTRCEREKEEVLVQSFDACGRAFEKCCAGDSCDDDEFECRFDACLPSAACSLPGDRCCDGGQCANEFLRCEKMPGSVFENHCVRCGGEAQQCCMDSDEAEYCAGSNMKCESGVCIMTPGPCDQNQKGCCTNTVTGVRYCATSSVGRLACDIAAAQDADSIPACEFCGNQNRPCCFPSSLDAATATSWQLGMAPAMCNIIENAETLACMLDEGSADDFNRCVPCGRAAGEPCCWRMQSDDDPSVANTAWDVMVPSCSANLACQEFMATNKMTLDDASNFYRCVEANDAGLPVSLDGACGGKAQRCCSSGNQWSQCGSGLTCNLESAFCQECGGLDQLCCPGALLLPELQHPACKPGLGCGSGPEKTQHTCTSCGSQGAPCCWDAESGFTCTDQNLECLGLENGWMECT